MRPNTSRRVALIELRRRTAGTVSASRNSGSRCATSPPNTRCQPQCSATQWRQSLAPPESYLRWERASQQDQAHRYRNDRDIEAKGAGAVLLDALFVELLETCETPG